MTQLARLKKAAVGLTIRGGLAGLYFHDRLVLHLPDVDVAADLIEGALPEILGVTRVEVAISIGRTLRPNLKPVFQVMAPDGSTLAYAKLGWNRLTAELVHNEAARLRALERHRIETFRIPRVLHEGRWRDSSLVVLSPVPLGMLRSRPVSRMPPAQMLVELAGLGVGIREPLTESDYWSELRSRAAALGSRSVDDTRAEEVVGVMTERMQGVEVDFGMSHGDLAPWNMAHTRGALNIWDWERASESRPVGFDPIHFAFEVALHQEHRGPIRSADHALERSRDVLRHMGVVGSSGAFIRDAYLLERSIRLLEGRREGVPVDDALIGALLALLLQGRGG